ncbi:MAG: hypothetical protein LUC45_08185 [Paraprevotella sp.]|nr:hypothetical protein [Paraprevotella sp.]
MVDVATGLSTEAVSFDGKSSDLMLSPESAVTQAMQSLQGDLEEYFRKNFPETGKIIKILSEKKNRAETVLLNVGNKQGIKVGDKFMVSSVEMIEGEPYPTDLGEIKVDKLSGDTFSECTVPSDIGEKLKSMFTANANITCRLIIK